MKKIFIIKVSIVLFLVSLFVLLTIKHNINIYVADCSYNFRSADILLKIDDELILKDTLISSPFFPCVINQRLRYGFHTVHVSSEQANVNQEDSIFLLPNQYIYIEFLGADTLYLKGDSIFNENFLNEKDNVPLTPGLDTMKIVIRSKSKYIVESRFNPFYTE